MFLGELRSHHCGLLRQPSFKLVRGLNDRHRIIWPDPKLGGFGEFGAHPEQSAARCLEEFLQSPNYRRIDRYL